MLAPFHRDNKKIDALRSQTAFVLHFPSHTSALLPLHLHPSTFKNPVSLLGQRTENSTFQSIVSPQLISFTTSLHPCLCSSALLELFTENGRASTERPSLLGHHGLLLTCTTSRRWTYLSLRLSKAPAIETFSNLVSQ